MNRAFKAGVHPKLLSRRFESLNLSPYPSTARNKQITRRSGLLKWIFLLFRPDSPAIFVSAVPFSFFWVLVSHSGLFYQEARTVRVFIYSISF
jgi:hypothetical protein